MRRRFAVLGAALGTAAALVVLVGSTAFAQVPGGYGYGPGGYGNGYGMMGGYNGWGYQQAPSNWNGYYGWGCGGWDW